MSKFLIGEEVYHYERGKCTIIDYMGCNFFDEEEYKVEFPDKREIMVTGSELNRRDERPRDFRDCECGAWKVKGWEGFHSNWCKMYVDKRY